MSVQIVPFDQANQELRNAAHEYCAREVPLPPDLKEWNLGAYEKAWIAVEDGEVVGVTAFMYRVDIAVFRSTSGKATTRLNHRLHSYFADIGLMGRDILIHLSNAAPDKQCANWQQEIERADLTPADRFLVRVKPL